MPPLIERRPTFALTFISNRPKIIPRKIVIYNSEHAHFRSFVPNYLLLSSLHIKAAHLKTFFLHLTFS